MELFVLLESRQDFLHRSSELSISGAEALKPAFNRVINWLCGGQMSKDVGSSITKRNESYSAAVAREQRHIGLGPNTIDHSPPVHVAAVRWRCSRNHQRSNLGMHSVGTNDDIELALCAVAEFDPHAAFVLLDCSHFDS